MSFGWLGTFRQGQWRAFRTFVLNERRDVGRRMSVIEAELTRIGTVTVFYGVTDAKVVTEERIGFTVSSGSSLEKLLQAYTAQGGNPFDISMFLTPDATFILDPDAQGEDGLQDTQPYGGVIYAKSQLAGLGSTDEGGDLNIKKYWPARAGGVREFQDTTIVNSVDLARRWVNQTIVARRHDLEARIIKLCDLREQLQHELERLTTAVGGTVGSIPQPSTDLFDSSYGVAQIVASIDSVFYATNEDGTPDLNKISPDAGPNIGGPVNPNYVSLFTDISPDEDNTAL